MNSLKVTAMSDLHGRFPDLPGGDLLIDAGDFTFSGSRREVIDYMQFLTSQLENYETILFCAGNHEFSFDRSPNEVQTWMAPYLSPRLRYVKDETIDVRGFKVFLSPYQPTFCDMAFNVRRGLLFYYWDRIPLGTDILVTHGPPRGFGDQTFIESVGCDELLDAVKRVRPKFHVFGHVHEGYGCYQGEQELDGVTFINASHNDNYYKPVNPPINFIVRK